MPRGIESLITYRDLTLNNRRVVDKYRVTKLDGMADADVRVASELEPDEDGEIPSGDNKYGGRTIVADVMIEAYEYNKLRDMESAFTSAFLDINREYPLVFSFGPDRSKDVFINCAKYAATAGSDQQSDARYFRSKMLTLRASNPRFLSFMARWDVFQPVNSASYEFTIENLGNYPAHVVYRLGDDLGGEMRLVNHTTGQSLIYEDSIAAGKWIEFDTKESTAVDDVGANMIDGVPVESDWPKVKPGVNHFELITTSRGPDAYVRTNFHHSFF